MSYLSGALVFIAVISSLESKNLHNRQEGNYDLDTSTKDWPLQKWDSILSHSSFNKCPEQPANEPYDESSEFINSYKNRCKKNSKRKFFEQGQNMLDLSKEELFPSEDSFTEIDLRIDDSAATFESRNSGETTKTDQDAPLFEANQPSELEEFIIPAEDASKSTVHVASINSDNSDLNNKDPSDLNGQHFASSSVNTPPPISILPESRSFIFNPNAKPLEKFQTCKTPQNESGTCRYLQHCMIPNIVSSFNKFVGYVCIIENLYIGVCCPNLPVSVIVVQKQKEQNDVKINSTEECGISTNTRIVGGLNADPKAWPWMVALLSKSNKRFFCGGVLINHRYVLSAAHCTFGVRNNEIVARLGEYDFKDDGNFHNDYAVTEIKRHGQYNRRSLRNDIALLKLEKSVDFTEFIKAICFPEGENAYVGENATLAGWGNLEGDGPTSDVLQVASFPITSNEDCGKIHGVSMPHSLICTRATEGNTGACNGDSGGPLMLLDTNNRWKTIGLVSWGRRGCSPEFPTVYTRVSHFLKWIRKHSSD